MNKILFIALTLLISSNLFSQTKEVIGVNQQFLEKDTTRTFTILKKDLDKCIEKMTEVWGKPASATAGIKIWENVELKGIGSGLVINVTDGVFVTNEKAAHYTLFKSEKTKKKRLSVLQKNESRCMVVEIIDTNKKNIINTKILEDKAVESLTYLLKTIK